MLLIEQIYRYYNVCIIIYKRGVYTGRDNWSHVQRATLFAKLSGESIWAAHIYITTMVPVKEHYDTPQALMLLFPLKHVLRVQPHNSCNINTCIRTIGTNPH